MELRVEGIDELVDYLDGICVKLSSNDFWGRELVDILGEARRYAASISPVITGSYRDAHRVVVGTMGAELSIDPVARNTSTGIRVTRYAAPVEDRHYVYARTNAFVDRLSIDAIGEELLR